MGKIKNEVTENEQVSRSLDIESTEITELSKPETKKEAVIYIGSTLPDGTLQQYSVFNNGMPNFLEEHIKKCPAIESLMVPISEFSGSQRKLEEKGSLENVMNAQILQYVRSEV